ncbi:MAG TPA: TonB-dependent receptor, partial [Flavitalea sp.]|nr:TonB-dependent receptor [Flavitalea sp.]
KPVVTLNSGITFEEVILPEFQDLYTLGVSGEYRNGITTKSSTSWGARIDTLKVNGAPIQTFDPRDDFFRRGTNYNNTISLDGATENLNYTFSYSNLYQEGIVPTNDFNRNTVYFKLFAKISNKLNITTSLNYTNSKNSRAVEGNTTNSYLWTVWGAPINWNMTPPLNANGTQNIYRTGRTNPLWTVENVRANSRVNRFLPNITLAFTPLSWLTVTNRTGTDFYTDNKDFHEAKGSAARPNGRVYFEDVKSLIINNDLIVEARKSMNDIFISGLVGGNIYYNNLGDNYVQGDGLGIDNFYNISNASTVTSIQTETNKRKMGVYAQATAEYKKLVSLTLTARNDWSSAFYPKGKASYFYPSISGAFVFSEIIPRNDIITFGKLRLSYAEVGNDPPAYVTQTYFVAPAIGDAIRGELIFPYNGVNTYTYNNVSGNPDLKPERFKEAEAGLELKLFKDKINLDVSVYNKKSVDLISKPELAGSTGFVSAYLNTGSIRNKGIEVTLGASPFKSKSFRWDVNVNWSKNENTVLELSPGVQSIRLAGFTDPSISIYKDLPYGVIFGSKYARDDKTGQMLIDDDGFPLFLNDQGPLGYTQPKWIGGLVNTFSYKGLSLTAVMDYRKGGDILNFDNFYLAFYGTPKFTQDREREYIVSGTRQSDGQPNQTAISAKDYYQTVYAGSGFDFLVEDGTYFKLRQLSLNYDLPGQWFKDGFVKGVSINATGRNLIINAPNFSGADPEANLFGDGPEGLISNAQGFYHFVTPPTKSYSVNLKLRF